MDEYARTRPPAWFWVLAVLALVWSLAGVTTYLVHVYSGATGFSANLGGSMPAWVTGAYAISVFASLGGSIGLLLRRRWARALLIVSLIAVLAQFGWVLLTTGILVIGAGAGGFPVLLVGLPILFVWFASHAHRRGWLS